MKAREYHCAHNLRSRSSLVLAEMDQYWGDWVADEQDAAAIAEVVAGLKRIRDKAVAACLVYEREVLGTSVGWEKNHSANQRLVSDKAVPCPYGEGELVTGET